MDIIDRIDLLLLAEKRERVVRAGKIINRLEPRDGYKVIGTGYVKMTPQEMKLRRKGAKRGAKKKKSQKIGIEKARKRSLKLLRR